MMENVMSRSAVAPTPLYRPKMPFCRTRSKASRVAERRLAVTTVPLAEATAVPPKKGKGKAVKQAV